MSADAPEEEAPRPSEGDHDGEAQASPSPDAAPASDDAEAPPARRKRKKKRAVASSDEAAQGEAASHDQRAPSAGVPAFALNFPDDPALHALVAAFEQGDYARVRRDAPALVQQTDSAEVRKAARELVKRLDPDPLAVSLLAGTALLLAFLAFWYWTHPHVAP